MLTWMGFVGKLIELMVNKLAGKKIDLALDEKKKAAKAFVKFHEAVADLEQILSKLLTYLETFIENRNSRIYEVHLRNRVTSNLSEASSEFVESLRELGKVLYFYDPNLAALFGRVSIMKQGLLLNVYYFFEQSVRLEVESEYYNKAEGALEPTSDRALDEDWKFPLAKFTSVRVAGGSFCDIEYTMPNDTLMDNVEELAEQAIRYYENNDDYWNEFQAFQDSVITIIINNINHEFIGHEDKDKLIELYPKLKAHKELLTEAREGLREFIQKQFSLADVLHVAK